MSKKGSSSNGLRIGKATIADLDELVDLHQKNYNEKDLSLILGRKHITIFYRLALSDEKVRINTLKKDDKVIAMSMVFWNYGNFEKKFKSASILPFLKWVLLQTVKLNIASIFHVIKSILSKDFTSIIDRDIYDYYVGGYIIDEELRKTPAVLMNFYKMYRKNMKEFLSMTPVGCWAFCRESNLSSGRLVLDQGLEHIDTIDMYPERSCIFVYRKKQNTDNEKS